MSFLNRLDVLDVLGRGIRVVEAQIAPAAELACHAEVHADGFDVADVRKAVRLRRKARGDLSAKAVAGDVLRDHFANEVTTGLVQSSLLVDWTRCGERNSGSDGSF